MKAPLIWILILSLVLPMNPALAKKPVEDGAEVDVRACGTFKIEADLEEEGSFSVCRTDDRIRDKGWRTRDADTEVHVSKSDLKKAKSPKELLDQALLMLVREKVRAKIAAFSWVPLLLSEHPDDVEAARRIGEVTEKYEELKKLLLPDEVGHPRSEIKRLLTLYPDIEDEILREHPDYKPLICRYELRKHRLKILKTSGKVLAITASIALLLGGPATAYFWIPALPKLMMVAGGTEIVAGSLKIGHAIGNWDDVRAGKTAKALLDFDREIEKLLVRLRKDPERNKDLIRYLQDHRLTSTEVDRLKDVKKLRRKEYTELLSGILNTAFGAAAIYGGIKVGEHFLDFKADAPPNVTGGGVNGGGTTGGGTTGGGGGVGWDDGG